MLNVWKIHGKAMDMSEKSSSKCVRTLKTAVDIHACCGPIVSLETVFVSVSPRDGSTELFPASG